MNLETYVNKELFLVTSSQLIQEGVTETLDLFDDIKELNECMKDISEADELDEYDVMHGILVPATILTEGFVETDMIIIIRNKNKKNTYCALFWENDDLEDLKDTIEEIIEKNSTALAKAGLHPNCTIDDIFLFPCYMIFPNEIFVDKHGPKKIVFSKESIQSGLFNNIKKNTEEILKLKGDIWKNA